MLLFAFCMNCRKILNITLLGLCHLALWPSLLISQLPAAQPTASVSATPADKAAEGSNMAATGGEPVTIMADQQEKQGTVYHLRGHIEIRTESYVFRADQAEYDSATSQVTAEGHLSLDGGPHDEHITATNGTYNLKQQTGKLYNVVGSIGLHPRGRALTLLSPNPFLFTARMVERQGPTKFVLHDGTATSCALPRPKWSYRAGEIRVELGGEARIYHSVFELHGLPVLYFPYAEHPVDQVDRHSGFLIPQISQSSTEGTVLGDSYYWAINRSNDLTVGAEYFSKRGWSQHVLFRSRPTQDGSVNITYFGVVDSLHQGGQEAQVNAQQELPHDIRGVVSVDYLSSLVFREAFNESFTQAVNSEAKSAVFLTRNADGVSLNVFSTRYQNFESTTPGDEVTILRVPSFELDTVDRQLGKSPFTWGFDGAIEGLSRTTPSFSSDIVSRADVRPRLSLPAFFAGWTLRPEIAIRDTYYTAQQTPVTPLQAEGTPVDDPINRRDLKASLELRPPTLERIFEKPVFGQKIKHTVEEDFSYRHVNGIDNFGQIIRFDQRDILSDTNELEYGITNRLFLKHNGNCSETADQGAHPVQAKAEQANTKRCGARQFAIWRVAQKYFFDPTFGAAVIPGRANALASTVDFTGTAFLTEPRTLSPLISRLRIQPTEKTDAQWDLDYDLKKGYIGSSTLVVDQRFGDYFVGGSHAVLVLPAESLGGLSLLAPEKFNQFRVLVGYGKPDKRGLSAAANVGVDSSLNFLQYATVQSSYNWDCCGITLEYRRLALGAIRNENAFSFAFTIANIGTFGNLRQRQRLF